MAVPAGDDIFIIQNLFLQFASIFQFNYISLDNLDEKDLLHVMREVSIFELDFFL